MYSLGTHKISSTKSVYSPIKALRITNFAPFNAHTIPLTTTLFSNGLLFVPSYNSVRFGRKSIIYSTTSTQNYPHDNLTEYNFLSLTPRSLKILLAKFFISEYSHNHNIL